MLQMMVRVWITTAPLSTPADFPLFSDRTAASTSSQTIKCPLWTYQHCWVSISIAVVNLSWIFLVFCEAVTCLDCGDSGLFCIHQFPHSLICLFAVILVQTIFYFLAVVFSPGLSIAFLISSLISLYKHQLPRVYS